MLSKCTLFMFVYVWNISWILILANVWLLNVKFENVWISSVKQHFRSTILKFALLSFWFFLVEVTCHLWHSYWFKNETSGSQLRRTFRTLSNIQDGCFCERLLSFNHFRKRIHLCSWQQLVEKASSQMFNIVLNLLL